MRRRIVNIALVILGLGVPLVVAWLTRPRPADTPASVRPAPAQPENRPPNPAPTPSRPPAEAPVREPHPTGLFAAVGRVAYRLRKPLPVAGLALAIGLNVWALNAGGDLIQGGWVIEGSEEQAAAELLGERFGQQASTMLVVYRDPDGDATDPDFQRRVRESLEPIEGDPAVDEILTWGETRAEDLLSTDHRRTMAAVVLTEEVESAVEDSARLAELIEAPDGVEMQITGIPQLYHEFNDRIERDLVRAEAISLPIALVILLAVFGTLVAAGLPLVVAALSLPTTFAVIGLLAAEMEMSIFVTNIATMIGLALAIDYSLFMVSRFREELRHHDVEIAVERMMGSVGKAVAVSGVAVAIGLSSLVVFEAAALRSMGIAGIVTVISTLLYGLTVLPALLALLGPRVNRLRIPLPRALRLIEDDPEAADRRQGHGAWAWIAARVMRRPIMIAGPVLVLLLLLGSPFASIQLSTGQNLEDLPPTPARLAFETILDEFPGGETDPITVAVSWPGEDLGESVSPERQADLATYVDQIAELEGVTQIESVLDPPPGLDEATYRQLLALPADQRPAEVRAGLEEYLSEYVAQDTVRLRVFSSLLPDSDAGRQLVRVIRDLPAPDGAQALTGGLPSRSADFMDSFWRSLPAALIIVVAVTGGVLFLTFGSIFLPVKAVLMSLVSISASMGALVWVFQQGNLSELLGFEPPGTTAAWLPIIMFAILFGLSMDYEVLLLSRIRERYVATGDNTRAVAEGIGLTGGIITGAALIMVAVFGAFGLSGIVFIKALGLSMALAVLIDATVVRGILVPAFMRVMGRVNWWAPRWVQRAVARLGLYEGPDGPMERPERSAPVPATG
ncbi:MAG TPA: MMPL family transporter [candidate division Zixibacteria bacterium]|nr:MMPL family transporter [candidate division Zixibacteria bacterium]